MALESVSKPTNILEPLELRVLKAVWPPNIATGNPKILLGNNNSYLSSTVVLPR